MAITGCSSPAKKVENAQSDVEKANRELEQANKDYIADIEAYKKETNEKILANDRTLSEFNTRIEAEKTAVKKDYTKKIAELDQKNSDMKKRLDEYTLEGKDKWEIFKAHNTLLAQGENDDNIDMREKLTFGIKAGINYSNVWDEQGQDFEADPRVGF
eukprot:gene4934-6703_t